MNITIASMNARGEIDQKVLSAARQAKNVVIQTDIADVLSSEGIVYSSLDPVYESATDFNDLIDQACSLHLQDGLLFIALGDVYFNSIAAEMVRRVIQKNGHVLVIPGGDPALCLAFQHGLFDSNKGFFVFSASTFSSVQDTDMVLAIHEIDSRLKAGELKLKLSRYYGDDHPVFLADLRAMHGQEIPLSMLDAGHTYGYYTSIVILPDCLEQKNRYTFSDLVSIMDVLRSRNGCPWDIEQTHESLKRYLIEESYEVLEAIDKHDMNALFDELGDVLLQIVFHAKIADQNHAFDVTDITTAICKKMISRHAHIFGTVVANTPEAVIKSWESIKKQEKGQYSQTEAIRSIPQGMPALMRSEKVQNKAAHIGFDFEDIFGAIDKLKEEIAEIENDLSNHDKLIEECGDLLFSAVNISRLAGVEPELALKKSTDKFIDRFAHVEKLAAERSVDMHTCGIDTLNDLWIDAKNLER